MNTKTLAQQIFDALDLHGPMTSVALAAHVAASASTISSVCSRMSHHRNGAVEQHGREWSPRWSRMVLVWRVNRQALRPFASAGRPSVPTIGAPPPSQPMRATPSAPRIRTVVIDGREFEVVWDGCVNRSVLDQAEGS